MRIGYFITKYPYNYRTDQYLFGGASVAAYNLSIQMARRNYKIDVYTSSFDNVDSVEMYKNLRIMRYGTNFKVYTTNISFGMFFKTTRNDVDIIHTHFDIPPGPFAGLKYAKDKKVPLILTYHGDWIDSYGGAIRRLGVAFYNKYLVDKILSHANAIISPSEYFINQSYFLKKYRDKVSVIPNGINLSDFNIEISKEECRSILNLPQNKNILLSFGNLSPYKGLDILLKAFKKIMLRSADILLIVVGTGVMEKELMQLALRLGIERNVKFTGFVEDKLKPIYYRAADIFCLPSTMTTESFGIVNLEAMACGLPIVASRIGGIPDIIKDGENGLLVIPKDSDSLSNAIISLLEDTSLRTRMEKNAMEKIKNYTWEKVADETEKMYAKVVKI